MARQFATALVAVSCVAALSVHAQDDAPDFSLSKKLIEYGWDVPSPDYVREHIREMERRPFDGLIFKLHGGGKVLTPTPWDPAQFAQDYEDVQQIAWDRFTDNFVIMWAASDQDWFNDEHWEAIVHNARLMAKAARLARCAGICFDAEPYGTNPWLYAKAAHRDTKTFEEYHAIVRKRGAQFIQAIEAELPAPEILTFFLMAYAGPVCKPMDPQTRVEKLSQMHYGLLAAFLEGMLEGSGPDTRFHDGNESAYYYTQEAQYFQMYHHIMQRAQYAIDPALWDAYRAKVRVAQALYMDQYFGLRERKVLGHFMTPQERPMWFEHNAYWALLSSDKYVWCYSEKMNWWEDRDVPRGAEDALRAARSKYKAGQPLGFDLAPLVADASMRQRESLANRLEDRSAEIPQLAAGTAAPVIDGQLDDAAWQAVAPLEDFLPVASAPNPLKVATRARVMWNKECLFVAFHCEEPNTKGMYVFGDNRDDYVFSGEVVELMLEVGKASAYCYHFAVNPKGVFWDGTHSNGTLDTGYNPDWACAAHIDAGAWTVEMAIPWAAFDVTPRAGGVIRANLFRERARQQELSAWSPPVTIFLEPERFGAWTLK
ncbi:MAG: carbohydrate-binding family 9-like protein [Candidatus Hydrogenedentes bacterium]|nr:carbohydrate-binding family 9-like protein [Candidatus Hydrogenedentota bacterium]